MKWTDYETYIELKPPKEFCFKECLTFLNRSSQEVLHYIENDILYKLINMEGKLVLLNIKSTTHSIQVDFPINKWKKNENSPRLTVQAVVKSKRTNVTRHNQQNEMGSTSTIYFVTFEFESGDRLELRVSGKEYGLLADGDVGTLTFQGTRYLDFVREM